jgi:hypothetical protein
LWKRENPVSPIEKREGKRSSMYILLDAWTCTVFPF